MGSFLNPCLARPSITEQENGCCQGKCDRIEDEGDKSTLRKAFGAKKVRNRLENQENGNDLLLYSLDVLSQETMKQGVLHQLSPAVQVEFLHDARPVRLHALGA